MGLLAVLTLSRDLDIHSQALLLEHVCVHTVWRSVDSTCRILLHLRFMINHYISKSGIRILVAHFPISSLLCNGGRSAVSTVTRSQSSGEVVSTCLLHLDFTSTSPSKSISDSLKISYFLLGSTLDANNRVTVASIEKQGIQSVLKTCSHKERVQIPDSHGTLLNFLFQRNLKNIVKKDVYVHKIML